MSLTTTQPTSTLFFCQIHNIVYFLDVRKNSYFAMPVSNGSDAVRLLNNIANDPLRAAPSICLEWQKKLSAIGLTLTLKQISSLAYNRSLPIPSRDFYTYAAEHSPEPTKNDAIKMFCSFVLSKFIISFMPFHWIVSRIRKRRLRNELAYNQSENVLRDKVEIYFQIKPFLFTSSSNCLFDSLVLIEYLALNNQYPYLVFGIDDNPFFAHCWVQTENVILNNALHQCALTTPIMHV